jgi:hypothetical protein
VLLLLRALDGGLVEVGVVVVVVVVVGGGVLVGGGGGGVFPPPEGGGITGVPKQDTMWLMPANWPPLPVGGVCRRDPRPRA